MIKAVLVDDELLVLIHLEKIIGETNGMQVIGAFTDPEQALNEIPRLEPDVLFLDVDMPEMSGIELATTLMQAGNEEMAIVFVTSYEQYAIHAFELNAIHYILKPVDRRSVDEVLKRVYKKRRMERKDISKNSEICLFGNMHLRINDHQTEFMTAKLEELFALLIMHREKGISKWQIIDILWEDSSMEKSQQNLYTMIFRLKKLLRTAGIVVDMVRKNGIYKIVLTDVHCDLIEFDKFINKKLEIDKHTLEEFEKNISLYQGDLFEGKDYIWCIHTIEGYYQQYVHLVKEVAKYYSKNECPDQLDKLFHTVKPIIREEDLEKIISII
ncbi:response regulator [Sporosarcina sp. GW1-11]|uniref:response regulator n=1 Tax=Sporosarcina sp. GW1-11 TaxID=2899126 RepID=UPI00294BFE55|nr:response regulator [Sporosarcina sp. GW1-11]MDV6378196.1 response regulator [Sporosarcina sp. GW1-11]